jgi:hypothetical protein
VSESRTSQKNNQGSLTSEGKTLFKQHSEFTGLATAFIGNEFVESGKKGFSEMERALKERVEKQIG